MVGWEYGPHPLEPKEIDGVLVPPSKAYTPDYRLTSGLSLPREEVQVKPFILVNLIDLVGWLFGCHDILMLSRSPIEWRQSPKMIIAVDGDAKPQLKQTAILTII